MTGTFIIVPVSVFYSEHSVFYSYTRPLLSILSSVQGMNSRHGHSVLDLSRVHEEGVENGYVVGQHGDFQLVHIL